MSSGNAGSAWNDNIQSTYGFAPSGDILAAGYAKDVAREKAVFNKGCGLLANMQGDIDSKTWWLVRDNLRGQAYNMKANMKALNKVRPARAILRSSASRSGKSRQLRWAWAKQTVAG